MKFNFKEFVKEKFFSKQNHICYVVTSKFLYNQQMTIFRFSFDKNNSCKLFGNIRDNLKYHKSSFV